MSNQNAGLKASLPRSLFTIHAIAIGEPALYADAAVPSCGWVYPHQVRHFFGDELKQEEVSKEFRADLLGHGGESETAERYCNPIRIAKQMKHLLKRPVVTSHLEPRPINLLPWVVAKEIALWSKAAKAQKVKR